MVTLKSLLFFLICFVQCIASTGCSSISVKSDEKVYVVSSDYNGYASFVTASGDPYISGVEWIWKSGESVTTASFYKIFEFDNPTVANIQIAADDYYHIYLNNQDTGFSCTIGCFSNIQSYNVINYMVSGINTLEIWADNYLGFGGLTFKLTVSNA